MSKKLNSPPNTLVYSTDHGRICPDCGKPVKGCTCSMSVKTETGKDQKVRISRSTKGRKGKGVSIISGLALPAAELKSLAGELKKALGVGGTARAEVIEIQSDNRELILKELEKRGFRAKLAGS